MAISIVKAIINGTTYNLSLNDSTGAYEATLTAPGTSSHNQTGGYYGITVTAYDDSGNSTTVNQNDSIFGDNLKLVVKENVAPIITPISPTNGAKLTNNKPTISWKCVDSDSGVNPDTIKMYLDGTIVDGTINAVKSGTTYTCTYIPTTLSDGTHEIKYVCSDYDGNSIESSVISIIVDTVAPTLTVSAPSSPVTNTNVSSINVSGQTNDITSSPVTVTVNGQAATVNSSGYFSKDVTLSFGTNTITVVATDSAGKSTTVTRTVNYNNVAPVFTNISLIPNPVDAGKTFKISVVVSDS